MSVTANVQLQPLTSSTSSSIPCCSRRRPREPSSGPSAERHAHAYPVAKHTDQNARKSQEDTSVVGTLLRAPLEDAEGGSLIAAVFDGHGGSEVSTFFAKNLEAYVDRELVRKGASAVDAAILSSALLSLDADLQPETSGTTGSTGTVCIVNGRRILCANTGDSRAILVTKDGFKQLSFDHNLYRQDERDRVVAAGGSIFRNGGADRVMGTLAMSRAFGDKDLRQYGVIPDPDVTDEPLVQHRDDCIVIASDGLWDVLKNDEVAGIARDSLEKAAARGGAPDWGARVAARVLTKAAISRGSRDNITVVVIDLDKDRVRAPSDNMTMLTDRHRPTDRPTPTEP